MINNKGSAHLIILVLLAIAAIGTLIYVADSNSLLSQLTQKATNLPFINQKEESPEPNPFSQVEITKDGFNPASITVGIGSQITFINKDSAVHNLKIDIEDFESESLNPNDSTSFVVEEAGTIGFQDPTSPSKFKGEIVVK